MNEALKLILTVLFSALCWAGIIALILFAFALQGCRPEDQVEGGGRPWPQEQTYLPYNAHPLPERPLNGSLVNTPRYWP